MTDFIYADNAATTRLSDKALQSMMPWLTEQYGNASALYRCAREARHAVDQSRAAFANGLNCSRQEIYFTSSASESNNWAIKSTCRALAQKGKKHIITDNIEHHSVLHSVETLKAEGFEVTVIPANADGLVSAADVAAAIRPDTALVSIMAVNNELGTVQPFAEIGKICREAGVLYHCDAVQAAAILPLDVKECCIDLLTMSAHKFHGPKGVGVLYARRGCVPPAYIEGGEQEKGCRAGTENVAGIVGAAVAFEEACGRRADESVRLAAMRDRVQAELLKIPGSRVNGANAARIPGTLSMSFEGVDGQSLVFALDTMGIAASSGSACAAGSIDPSHVMLAVGLPYELAHGSLRLSFGFYNTEEEADRVIECVTGAVRDVRSGICCSV